MANGTIAFDTLQTSGQITGTAKSLDTDYVVTGSAKMWANVDQTGTQALVANFGISSISDTGVGNTTLSYTNAMGSTAYVATEMVGGGTGSTGDESFCCIPGTSLSTSSLPIRVRLDTGTASDADIVCIVITGDLA